MNTKTELEKEVGKNIIAENEVLKRLEAKKEKLQQLKVEYSATTDRLYASNQSFLRMKKALKQQSKDIRTDTSSYIDNCVGLALSEAESAFFAEMQSELKENLDYVSNVYPNNFIL
jgi:LPS O-antigen subunit length determinant protein (WzzB/FepE family)